MAIDTPEMTIVRILDRNITPANFGAFRAVAVINDGRVIRFIMAAGNRYDVSLGYFLTWYRKPHYSRKGTNWVDWRGSTSSRARRAKVKFTRARRVMAGRAARIYLSNRTAYLVPWDTVLMACEERYEHFGGLTSASKRVAAAHQKRRSTSLPI